MLEQVASDADVQTVSRRLVRQLGKPFQVAGSEVKLSVSVGVSLFPRDGATAANLVALADAAMYRAKRAGKDLVVFHGSDLAPVS